MKLCKDCRNVVVPERHWERPDPYTYARCGLTVHTDPVSGDAVMRACSTERAGHLPTDCGPKGQHWAPIIVGRAA
jgi:hypothetical protein